MHNGVTFRVVERVVPQAVIVLRHGVAFGAHGVVAVSHQAGCDTGGLCAYFRAVAIHRVEQRPFFIVVTVGLRSHKRASIAEGVKIPDTPVVVRAETVHPGEDMWLQGYPLRDGTKVLWPEADALLIGQQRGDEGVGIFGI